MGMDIAIGSTPGSPGGRRAQPPGAPRGRLVVVGTGHDRTAHPGAEPHVHVHVLVHVGRGCSGEVDLRHIVPAAGSPAHQRTLAFLRCALPET